MAQERIWRNVELDKSREVAFKVYLKSKNIRYEPSGADPLVHFEVFCNDDERKEAEDFLSTLY